MTLSPIEYFWVGVAAGWIASGVAFWLFSMRSSLTLMNMSDARLLSFAKTMQRELMYRWPTSYTSRVRLPSDPP